MPKERDIANSLRENSVTFQRQVFFDIAGCHVIHPYTWINEMPYNQPINASPEVFESLHAMDHLFNPENIPQEWVELIEQIGELRRKNCCKSPFDLINSVQFVVGTENNPELSGFGFLETRWLDLRDKAKVIEVVNSVLHDDRLRRRLLKFASTFLPDKSVMPIDEEEVIKELKKLGINSGVLLDLGCGTGEKTATWQETGLHVVGLDRQYYPNYYGPHWHNENPNTAFVRSDFMQGLPFADNSADAAVMLHVIEHISDDGTEMALRQLKKVLKVNSVVFVGPQLTNDYSDWRIFKKTRFGKYATRWVECKIPLPDWVTEMRKKRARNAIKKLPSLQEID